MISFPQRQTVTAAPGSLPADDAIILLDAQRRIHRASPQAAGLLQMPMCELVGLEWEDLGPLDRLGVTVREQPLCGRSGRSVCTLVHLSAVQAPIDHFDSLVQPWEYSSELVCVRDEHGRLLSVNQAFARKFGIVRSAWRGRDLVSLVHPDDLAEHRNADLQLRRPPHRATWEVRLQTAQGWRWLSWEEGAVRDADGQVVAFRAVGRDVTKRRLAEEHFSKLASAVEQAPHSMIMTTTDGRVQYVNPRYTQVTGYTLEEIFEKEIPVLRDGHPTEESYQTFRDTVGAGRKWNGELCTRTKDGRTVWEFVLVSPIRNHADEITHLLCLREDITERKRLEDQLRQSQKMESLGTLAGGIAHDFNNLLAIINGFAELAMNRAGNDDSMRKYLREIHGAGARAIGLVKQILTFSRKGDISFRQVSLNQLIHDLGRLFTETFPRMITFEFDLDTKLPMIVADQSQLQQVILNLCVNARDAMPQGGNLTVATALAQGAALARLGADTGKRYVHIRVSDTGVGMPAHVRARIFEPFFTTKQNNGGTGLGLAVVYGIILNHKGLLDVESSPGQGSTFHIYLPLEQAGEQAAPVAPSTAFADVPAGVGSVLIVEDESSLRELLRTVLTQRGYVVHTVDDGEQAAEFLMGGSTPVDAALLDLNLPKLNGVEVFKILRHTRPQAKAIIVSGNITSDVKRELTALGQQDFIGKPYTLADLGRTLHRLLGAPSGG